jgi:hypothetical protein
MGSSMVDPAPTGFETTKMSAADQTGSLGAPR